MLDYEVISFVLIQLQSRAQATLQAFEKSIAAFPLAQQSWRISGGADYLLKCVARSVEGMHQQHGNLPRCLRSARSGPSRCLASQRMRRYRFLTPQLRLARRLSHRHAPVAATGPNASRARRAGMRNCRHRQPADEPKPWVRSPGRECPCARNRRSRLPWSRSVA